MIDITAGNQRILVNQTGTERVCLRCLNSNMETSTTTQWIFPGGLFIAPGQPQPTVGTYFDGVVELVPGFVGNGVLEEVSMVRCFAVDITPDYNYVGLTFYSSGEWCTA